MTIQFATNLVHHSCCKILIYISLGILTCACAPKTKTITFPNGKNFTIDTYNDKPICIIKNGFSVQSFKLGYSNRNAINRDDLTYIVRIAYPPQKLHSIIIYSLIDPTIKEKFYIRELTPLEIEKAHVLTVDFAVFQRSKYPTIWKEFEKGKSFWAGFEVQFFTDESSQPTVIQQLGMIHDWEIKKIPSRAKDSK